MTMRELSDIAPVSEKDQTLDVAATTEQAPAVAPEEKETDDEITKVIDNPSIVEQPEVDDTETAELVEDEPVAEEVPMVAQAKPRPRSPMR